jgi:hypothetical protein
LGGLVLRRVLKAKPTKATGIELPANLTPFTVLGLLQRLRRDGHLPSGDLADLDKAIALVEEHYFAAEANGNGQVDLRELAHGWVAKVR